MGNEQDKQDPLLGVLGARLAQRQAEMEWEAVAREERELDDVAERRRRAGDSEEQIARDSELFRPMDEDEHEELVERLPLDPPSEPAAEPTRKSSPANARPWLIGAALALAASVALWWVVNDQAQQPKPVIAANPKPVPEYLLETDGGLETKRGAHDPAPLRYRPSTRFEWRLSPMNEVEKPLELRTFAFSTTGAERELDTDELARWNHWGVVTLQGEVESLGLEPGAWSIVIVVGRPQALPAAPVRAGEIDRDKPLQVVTIELSIEAEP